MNRSTSRVRVSKQVSIPFGRMRSLNRVITATPDELKALSHIIKRLKNTATQLSYLHTHTIEQFIEQITQLLQLHCMADHQESIKTNAHHVFFHLIHQAPNDSIQSRYWRYMDDKEKRANLDAKIATINSKLSNIGAISCDSEHDKRSPIRSPHATYSRNLTYQLNKLLDSKSTKFEHDFSVFRQNLSHAKNTPYVEFDELVQLLYTHLSEQFENDTSPQTNTMRHYLHQCKNRIQHPLPEHLQLRLDELLLCYNNDHNKSGSRRISYKFEFLTALSDTIKNNPEKNHAECYRLVEASSRPSIQALLSEKSWTLFGEHRFKNFITDFLNAEPNDETTTQAVSHVKLHVIA